MKINARFMPQIYSDPPHTDIYSLKAFFMRVLIAYSYNLYECIQSVFKCLEAFILYFCGPLKCHKRIDKHAVNQQTEIIS